MYLVLYKLTYIVSMLEVSEFPVLKINLLLQLYFLSSSEGQGRGAVIDNVDGAVWGFENSITRWLVLYNVKN